MESTGCPETSVMNYHYTLRDNLHVRRFQENTKVPLPQNAMHAVWTIRPSIEYTTEVFSWG